MLKLLKKTQNMLLVSAFYIVAIVLVFFSSCSKKDTVPPGPSLDNLYQSWHTLSTLQKANVDYITALQISEQMISSFGEEGINKLFHVIEDENEKPMAKMLAVMSLTPYVKENWKDKLIPLTATGKEVNTRVCAINLLSLIQTPEVTNYMKTLSNDPEPRVRFEVLTALSKRGEPEGINRINELWDLAKDNPEQKQHIFLCIPPEKYPDFLNIIRSTAQDEILMKSVRMEALTALGRMGKEEDIEILKNIIDKETEGDVRELAQTVIDVIHARYQNTPPSP